MAKLNICYYRDSRYFNNDVMLRLNDKIKFEYYLSKFDVDAQDRIIDNTNNYFYIKDVSLKKYIYLPVVKMLYYFALKAIERNSATITIYNKELLKVFNIEPRTLREYYKRLSLILPSLYYVYFYNLKQNNNIFCKIDFSNKAEYITIRFNQTIYNNHIRAGQILSADFNTLIFDNYKFNSKYDSRAFYIYLAYMFNNNIDFSKLVSCCYEHLEQTEKAQQSGNHLKQQIYNPIVKAINKLLFYNLLKIKQNSNSIFDFIFDNGYINEDNLYFVVRQIEQYYKATKLRVIKNHLSEWKELNKLNKQDFILEYKQLFNLLYI